MIAASLAIVVPVVAFALLVWIIAYATRTPDGDSLGPAGAASRRVQRRIDETQRALNAEYRQRRRERDQKKAQLDADLAFWKRVRDASDNPAERLVAAELLDVLPTLDRDWFDQEFELTPIDPSLLAPRRAATRANETLGMKFHPRGGDDYG